MSAIEIAKHLDDNGYQNEPIADIVDEILELLPSCPDDWAACERAERLAANYVQGLYR